MEIRLKNGEKFEITPESKESLMIVPIAIIEDFVSVFNAFTEDNLEIIETLDDTGNVCGIYKDKYVHNGAHTVPVETGYNVIFELKNVDLVQKRLKVLEAENAKRKVSLDAALEAIDYLLLGDVKPEAEV